MLLSQSRIIRLRPLARFALCGLVAFQPIHFTFAQNTISGFNGNNGSRAIEGNGSTPSRTTTTTPAPIRPQPVGSNSNNMNQGSRAAQGAQMLGGLANGAMGGMLVHEGMVLTENPETSTQGYLMIAMGVAALAQAAATLAASKGSKGVGDSTDSTLGDYGSGESSSTEDSFSKDMNLAKAQLEQLNIDKKMAEAASKGVIYNPNSGLVNTPMGPVNGNAMLTPQGMAAAGMEPELIAKVQSQMANIKAKVQDRMNVVTMGLDSGGGGGGGGGSGHSNSKFDLPDYSLLLNGAQPTRAPTSVAGMQLMAGGDPIGVKADNIFQMVHRKYQAKRKASFFIEVQEPQRAPNALSPAASRARRR